MKMDFSNHSLYLMDGTSAIFRCYYALPPMSNSKGEPTGAIYGVVNLLRSFSKNYRPTHLAFILDAPGPTFRHRLAPDYKAHRPPAPPDLRSQIDGVKEILIAAGVPLIVADSEFEADDVIASLARRAVADGGEAVVVSNDKDLMQLVGGGISMIDPNKNMRFDPAGVTAKMGVPPELVGDYLALVGDQADNIAGVAKCGPKTAVRWLEQYGSLTALIEHAHEIGGVVGENLRAAVAKLPATRELVALREDIELERAPADLKLGLPDRDGLEQLLARYEFRTWLAQTRGGLNLLPLPEEGIAEPPAASGAEPVPVILTEGDWQSWNAELKAAEAFAMWILADDANPRRAKLVGVAWAIAGKVAYLPLGHRAEGTGRQLSAAKVLADLKPLLESGAGLAVGHDLKQQWGLLAESGIDFNAIADDLMLLSYVAEGGRHDFVSLTRHYLGRELPGPEALLGEGKNAISFAEAEIDKAAAYAVERAAAVLAVRAKLGPRVDGVEGLRHIYRDLELPLLRILARMERSGILIDAGLLGELSREMAEEAARVQQRAHEIAGTEFNLASPGQVGELLYGKLGLPVLRKTPKGQPSTSEEVLEELSDQHELPGLVLRHRSVEKLRGTYTEKLPREIDPRTGRVHSSFQQAVASTGRLSSTDPNLQNIPIRGERGKRIRTAFIAPEGQLLVAADYSQIELRIVAHMSADATLLQAFAEGQDVHSRTAAEIMGVPLAEVTTEQRRIGKEINFAIIYGMSAFSLSRRLKIDRGEAEHYIGTYFSRYPGVRAYRDRAIDKARERGYAETLYGRRIYLPEINAKQVPRRRHAERVSVNAPVQGTAADVIKMAMIAVDRQLDASSIPARLLLQVHDELVFEVAEDAVDQLLEMLPPSMGDVVDLEVPLRVDVGAGASWGAIKD